MKILALSSTLHPIDFDNIVRSGIALNPSHQHYYFHLLTSLSSHAKVDVLSLFPAKKIPGVTKTKRLFKSLTFYYPKPYASPILRWWSYRQRLHHYVKTSGAPDIVLVDSSSRLISRLAQSLRGITRLVIITDHPRHLDGASLSRTKQFIHLHRNWEGYITLTESLNASFNPHLKPYVLMPGFVENRHVSSPQKRPYLFFSGALYTKYGLDIVLQAFLALKRPDLDLIIAGHGPEASLVERLSQLHPTIKFLGQLDHQHVYQYQGNALLNLHPRPLDTQRDLDSIPSKLFEYLSSGVPTMSTMHPFFYSQFQDEVEWIETNTSEEWTQRLRYFLTSDQTRALEKAQRLQAKIIQLYGYRPMGEKLFHFLTSVNEDKNKSST
jgi:glycosyltransferase involved in cell wall biosynthesis